MGLGAWSDRAMLGGFATASTSRALDACMQMLFYLCWCLFLNHGEHNQRAGWDQGGIARRCTHHMGAGESINRPCLLAACHRHPCAAVIFCGCGALARWHTRQMCRPQRPRQGGECRGLPAHVLWWLQPDLKNVPMSGLQTCVRTLYLPNYETEHELAEGLEEAFANAGALRHARL